VTEALPRPRPAGLSLPIVVSVIGHGLLLTAIVLNGGLGQKAMPPVYRVQLIAAPAGPRAEGVVSGPPATAAETKAPPAPTKRPTETRPGRRTERQTKAATPNAVTKAPTKTVAPKAGGGEVGGRGADVANVNTAGIEFPFPGYLNNIVRQIILAFEVPSGAQTLTAEVSFLIRRDGTVTGIRLLTSSRSYQFDQSALAAVEAAGRSGKFNPLPKEFSDDVLPVIFSFDPKRMR
jgi:TonB family protein